VYDDHVSTDMPFSDFKIMCSRVWGNDPHAYNFLVIDLESPINKGRYRKRFDEFIHI
jgi:hypothetical protein